MKLRVITNSQLRVFRRCQREHHLMYDLGYRAIEDVESLRFGDAIHRGLEAWWLGLGVEVAIERAVEKAVDAFEAAKLRVLLRGYHARWASECHAVAGVEVEFRAPLVNPETAAVSRTYELGGKIDVLLERGFIEHKTSSQEIGLGSVYWRKLVLDSQVSTYYAGAKALGRDVDHCIYDVIRKPGLRPGSVPLTDDDGLKIVLDLEGSRVRTKDGKKWRQTGDAALDYVLQTRPETPEEYEARLTEEVAANPDRYYQRGTVVRLEADEHEAQLDAWQLARTMREAELAGRHPRNVDACERWGNKLCAFFPVCAGTASLDDPSLYRRTENAHEELTLGATG